MQRELLEKVKKLVEKVRTVYLASSNKEGAPHIAASDGMAFFDGDRVIFKAWFCLRTVQNLQENPKLSLAVLDSKTQEGYQLLGEVEQIEKGAILNGYVPEKEKEWGGYPQAEHQLLIRIRKISHLTSGAHSDEFV